ncbi:universal stress protein [Aciduricibacillus chroicocephali]|uniref:Universal stress protein n=1 Tax=Aciduricibacillus chroicocephali TaxID=3054939 RepID=A0ABY9KSB1_9BACI|nr:universal stress protein [Bacillaceae bacterium 44XB]
MYRKFILAADGSQNGLRAADEAIRLAKLCDECVIDVVFVAEYANTRVDIPLPSSEEERELIEREQLNPVIDKINESQVKQTFTVLFGDPAMALTQYANEGDAEMVIVGKRGLNALQEMFLGSVSQQLIKKSEIPVLVVK